MKIPFTSLLLGLLFLCHGGLAAPTAAQLANLTHGTNVAWFSGSPSKFDHARARAELDTLNKTGVRHVRLCVFPPGFIRQEDGGTSIQPGVPAEISKAVNFALKEGLAVIVCPFHGTTHQRHRIPAAADAEAGDLVKMWGVLAKELAETDPNSVFLEIASEVSPRNPSDWNELQARCLQAIRQGAPKHLVIATAPTQSSANRYDSLKTLTALEPLRDTDVVYNFHYHGPMAFTHQGVGALGYRYVKGITGVPYPSRPDTVGALIAASTDTYATELLKAYRNGKWDRDTLRADLAAAAEWAKRNNVRLTCNEFGASRDTCPAPDRAAFLRDMGEIMDELGIGWTVREEGFGILKRVEKTSSLDAEAAKALGLTRP